ncbi:HAD hydrolase-like protein [Roseomonas frigidaquae]|uniref:HAD hydrolase-like protein n=1 Tax=Falsiroseomonas frigidaquae TaxID=487318 RepID=A0ABX1F5M9_9PROT|nr:HAD hydrolase-like protein [Falsiroseomonas frigidaquae]
MNIHRATACRRRRHGRCVRIKDRTGQTERVDSSIDSRAIHTVSARPRNVPRLALFDLDGTLADSRDLMFEALDQAARHFGFRRIDRTEAEALRDRDARTILRVLGVPLWKLPSIAAHIKGLATAAPPPPLFPGTTAMLARLRAAGVTLALVSSNSEVNARRALGAEASCCIGHWACDATLFGKASRFRQVLRRTGLLPGEAIAIGDELRDIAAARSAGLVAGAVAWGYALPSALAAAEPDILFASMAEIPAFFAA